jgi:Membrane protein implicated in regulation of membrane protease activity
MQFLFDLYANQPFWVWLSIGVVLLAIELALSSEWLLWPAVAAGIVAVLSALGMRFGFGVDLLLFAVLSMGLLAVSRKLIKRANPDDVPDINARDHRLVGQKARVVEPFVDGRGRVFVSGAEWAALIEGAGPEAGESVVVESIDGPTLKVRCG